MAEGIDEEVVRRFAAFRADPVLLVREQFGVEPDHWQAEALRSYPSSPRLVMKAPISVDEEVWTPTGGMKWGDVREGDAIFADDGTATWVQRRFDVGVVPLFRVKFRDGTSVRVSGDHLWRVRINQRDRRKGSWRSLTTAELVGRLKNRVGQRLINIPVQGAVEFPFKRLPLDPYLFGLWLGDGIANEPRLICPDPAIRREIRSRGHEFSESDRVAKRIGLHGLAEALRQTGAGHCRSFEKFIPELYKITTAKQRLELLRGLMDSDGTCAKNGHTYLATSSSELLADFLWLARSLGYTAKPMGPYRVRVGERLYRDSWRAVICGLTCPFLADTAKRRRWRAPKEGKTYRFIDSIEPDGEGKAMCVEVDHPSHCFQIGDFIVTHNCKGPGKSAVLSWIGWHFLLTRPHAIGGCTSVNADNLKTGLWTEFARWREKSPLLTAMFEQTKTTIFAREYPQTWKLEARSWARDADAQQQAASLAGLHAKYVIWLGDEAGDYPDAVLPTMEAILSGDPAEAHIVLAGNPTKREGPLYRACSSARRLWRVIEITGDPDDARRSPRIPLEHAKEQIAQYGRDNPWVLVNIFGQFPPTSLNALIGPDEVSAAMRREPREYEIGQAAKVIGVDVARFGDDKSVMCRRQGIRMLNFRVARNIDSTAGAGWVTREAREWDADAIFIDDTGGFGAGWLDQMRVLGSNPVGVAFSSEAGNKVRYYNKRSEIYFDFVEWIKQGGALPECPELLSALTQTTYTFKGDRLILEPKDEVKAKLGYSPDEADAAALTFTQAVQPRVDVRQLLGEVRRRGNFTFEYNPYASDRMTG